MSYEKSNPNIQKVFIQDSAMVEAVHMFREALLEMVIDRERPR